MSTNNYEAFQANKANVARMLQESFRHIEALSIQGWVDTIRLLQERIATDSFKVMVLGEFKRGKSTFINALLGEEILPAFATPCTAVINEIKWGEEKRALLHFLNPIPAQLPSAMPERAHEHIRKYSDKAVPPLQIPVEELEAYVVIPDPSKDQAESVAESPYSKVELFWPLKICSNGVVIIDSPGLNEHNTRTKITSEYLTTVDAVIFVISCHALASQSEMDVIDNTLIATGHEELLFVCNRFDEIRAADRERLVSFGRTKLAPKTTFGEHGLFFLSALNALEGRMDGDKAKVANSGLLPLEQKLERFLVEDRGRIKLFQPARELSRIIKTALNREIPQQRSMLDQSLSAVQQQYEDAKPRLEDAQRKRTQILRKIELNRINLRDDVRRLASIHNREICGELPKLAESYQPKNAIGLYKKSEDSLLPTGFKKQAEALTKEVVTWLLSKIEARNNEWRSKELEPLIKLKIEEMSSDVSHSMQEFLALVDEIKTDLSGFKTSDLGIKEPEPWERILAAAGGFWAGGIGSAVVGGTMGMKQMAISVGLNISVGLLAIALVGFNPLVIIPLMLATDTVQMLFRVGAMTDKIKSTVTENLITNIQSSSVESAEKVATGCFDLTKKLQDDIDAGMQKEIQAVHDQVQVVLKQLQDGESAVEKRRKALDANASALGTIDCELNDFVLALTDSLLKGTPSTQEKVTGG